MAGALYRPPQSRTRLRHPCRTPETDASAPQAANFRRAGSSLPPPARPAAPLRHQRAGQTSTAMAQPGGPSVDHGRVSAPAAGFWAAAPWSSRPPRNSHSRPLVSCRSRAPIGARCSRWHVGGGSRATSGSTLTFSTPCRVGDLAWAPGQRFQRGAERATPCARLWRRRRAARHFACSWALTPSRALPGPHNSCAPQDPGRCGRSLWHGRRGRRPVAPAQGHEEQAPAAHACSAAST